MRESIRRRGRKSGPLDLGRTVPTSRHSALVVVPEKVISGHEVDTHRAERKRDTLLLKSWYRQKPISESVHGYLPVEVKTNTLL